MMVSASSVPSGVRLGKPRSPILESAFQSISNFNAVEFMKVDISCEIFSLNDVLLMEIDTTVLQPSATIESAGKFFLICKFSRKNYKLLDIVTNLDRMTEVS